MSLIVFEGIDGTGKTSHSLLLEERLREMQKKVIRCIEPSNSVHGKRIREIMEKKSFITPEDEMKLFIEDRKVDVNTNIIPSLKAGYMVIMDRYYFSNAAYQGILRGFDWEKIISENESFAPKPDILLIFILDIPEAIKRIEAARNGKKTSMEKAEKLGKVQDVFLKIHDTGKYNSHIIDAAGTILNVENKIKKILEMKVNG